MKIKARIRNRWMLYRTYGYAHRLVSIIFLGLQCQNGDDYGHDFGRWSIIITLLNFNLEIDLKLRSTRGQVEV
jgi:hypothetical protein